MSEKLQENRKGKKCVVGDDTTKKERRAAKVAEKGASNKVSQQSIGKQENKRTQKQKVVSIKSLEEHNLTSSVKIQKIEISPTDTCQNNISTDIKKAEIKAERRNLQEKQRLSKITEKTKICAKSKNPPPKLTNHLQSAKHRHQVPLFNHLYNDSCARAVTRADSGVSVVVTGAGVHPAFARLSAQCGARTVIGSNARCMALLAALKQLLIDHVTPPREDFCRSLEGALQKSVDYLQNNSRKMSVSMSNALRHFKLRMTQIETNDNDSAKKSQLLSTIDNFLTDDIGKAGEAISISVGNKITDGDVILTYGCSSLIQRILLDAHAKKQITFHCIVVDSRPLLEGRHTLRILARAGIPCTYTLINGTCAIIGRATKVLLGAHALFANGSVMARTGTAQVAMVARSNNKPVMVCCETYKFCERAQVDSYVYNELGEPDALARLDIRAGDVGAGKWMDIPYLTPLNLMYDVTPPDYVTALVTELGMLPCTSVPVILRVKQDIP